MCAWAGGVLGGCVSECVCLWGCVCICVCEAVRCLISLSCLSPSQGTRDPLHQITHSFSYMTIVRYQLYSSFTSVLLIHLTPTWYSHTPISDLTISPHLGITPDLSYPSLLSMLSHYHSTLATHTNPLTDHIFTPITGTGTHSPLYLTPTYSNFIFFNLQK